MPRNTRLAFAVAGTLIAVASCGGGSPTTPSTGSGGPVAITITGGRGTNAFSPNPANVTAGQQVTFKNNDSVAHHVILDDGSAQTADIAPGATSGAISIGGNKSYHCTIHPGMVGGFNGSMGDPPPNCSGAYCGG